MWKPNLQHASASKSHVGLSEKMLLLHEKSEPDFLRRPSVGLT
jgi:hypothetical protein